MNYQLRGRGLMAPDWGEIINDLLRVGATTKEMSAVMGMQLTERMIRHYRTGSQPAYFRGELLIGFWCKRLSRSVEDVPRCEVVRGHRAGRGRSPETPKVADVSGLTDWLKPVQKAKGKPGRKPKVKAEAV